MISYNQLSALKDHFLYVIQLFLFFLQYSKFYITLQYFKFYIILNFTRDKFNNYDSIFFYYIFDLNKK